MKKIFGFLTALLVLSSCSKEFLNVNANLNASTTSRSDYQFTGALATTVSSMVGPGQTGGAWTGYYGFSTSFTGGGVQKTQIFSNTDFNYWDGPYHNVADYQYVLTNGVKEGFGFLVGPARIMQCYLYQRLVDMYGNIPYTQAMDLQNYPTPAYDDAQTIYKSLISRIDTAITEIKAATWPSSFPADIMFSGNKTRWIQLANSLKLRILVRQAYITANTSYITTELNKIVTEGTGFLTANAQVSPPYLKQTGKINPLYGNQGYNENDVEQTNHRFIKMGAQIINYMKNTNDIFRLQRVADPKVSGYNGNASDPSNYVGVPLGGIGSAYLETLVSSIGSAQVSRGDATRPMVFMQASEVYFLRAEAGQRYSIAGLGVPQTNYEAGISASFVTYANGVNVTANAAAAQAAAITYYSQPIDNVNWVASTDKLAAIATQKWVALCNYDGFEAWTEWRRTKVPTVPLSVAAGASTVQPRRFYYPISELNTNKANLDAQGAYSVYTSKIFWDK